MSKKTIALIVGLLILTILLLVVALNQATRTPRNETSDTESAENVSPTPPAETTLHISPNPLVVSSVGQGQAEVVINTGSNEVTAVQLEMSYDPSLITNIDIVPGTFLPSPVVLLREVDEQEGRITYAVAITPAQNPVKGQGTVATISFTQIPGSSGQTTLELMPKSLVTANGTTRSVLKTATGATVNLSSTSSVTFPGSNTSVTPSVSVEQTTQ